MKITIKKCLRLPDWLYIVIYRNEVIISGLGETKRDAFKAAFGACWFWLNSKMKEGYNV